MKYRGKILGYVNNVAFHVKFPCNDGNLPTFSDNNVVRSLANVPISCLRHSGLADFKKTVPIS